MLIFIVPGSVYAQDTVTVNTSAIADIAIYPERSAPATVISLNESTVSARIAAQVEELPVRVGDIVEKNSVLRKYVISDFLSHESILSGTRFFAMQKLTMNGILCDYTYMWHVVRYKCILLYSSMVY